MRKLVVNSVLFACLTGCASSPRTKIYQAMAAGALTGALYGLSKTSDQEAYALMWSGVGASVAGAVAVHYFSSDADVDHLQAETQRLQSELDRINSPRVEVKSSAFFGGKVPEKYQALINPGEWRVSRIDQWIEDDDNRLVHQDLVMDLTPPSLNPIIKPVSKKENGK